MCKQLRQLSDRRDCCRLQPSLLTLVMCVRPFPLPLLVSVAVLGSASGTRAMPVCMPRVRQASSIPAHHYLQLAPHILGKSLAPHRQPLVGAPGGGVARTLPPLRSMSNHEGLDHRSTV